MERGTVSKINARGFGFIAINGYQRDVFFHTSELMGDLEFNEQLIGHRICCDVIDAEKGPQARNVRAEVN